jgi:hypothetical protein
MSTTTLESELKRYRICRAEMERSCDLVCEGCVNQMAPDRFTFFVNLEKMVEGAK